MIYQKYCTSSPWCDDDTCKCETYAEHEAKEQGKVVMGIDWGLLDEQDEHCRDGGHDD